MEGRTSIDLPQSLRNRLRRVKAEVAAEYPEAEVTYGDVLQDLLDLRAEILQDRELEDVHQGIIVR